MPSRRFHCFKIKWVSRAGFKNGYVVTAPSSVSREEPAAGENRGVELQPIRQTGRGIGESAPVPFHLRSVEKMQLTCVLGRDAPQIDITGGCLNQGPIGGFRSARQSAREGWF